MSIIIDEKTKRYIAKLKMSGISLDIDTETNPDVPVLKSIILPDSVNQKATKIDISQLNNGNIILPIDIFKFDIDVNQIVYKPQPLYILYLLLGNSTQLCTAMMNDIAAKYFYDFGLNWNLDYDKVPARTLNNEKVYEVESYVKNITDVSQLDHNITVDEFYNSMTILIAWLHFKFSRVIQDKLTESDCRTPDIGRIWNIYMELVGARTDLILLYDLKVKDEQKKLSDLMKLMVLTFRDSVGDMYDIFTGEYRRTNEHLKINNQIHPICTEYTYNRINETFELSKQLRKVH
jgi:hypothetical protein